MYLSHQNYKFSLKKAFQKCSTYKIGAGAGNNNDDDDDISVNDINNVDDDDDDNDVCDDNNDVCDSSNLAQVDDSASEGRNEEFLRKKLEGKNIFLEQQDYNPEIMTGSTSVYRTGASRLNFQIIKLGLKWGNFLGKSNFS